MNLSLETVGMIAAIPLLMALVLAWFGGRAWTQEVHRFETMRRDPGVR